MKAIYGCQCAIRRLQLLKTASGRRKRDNRI
nr:MAG TPA: hypothetical protein [Caudoviricetes sp.]